jgi:protocatechuate 4,5-dioxygenase alpha chain
MTKRHDYDDIPGTFVFDAERSRQGYGINMFCMSLIKEENRKAFKANEAEYLKKFNLTPEQTEAILKRDYNRMLELGGNIYARSSRWPSTSSCIRRRRGTVATCWAKRSARRWNPIRRT